VEPELDAAFALFHGHPLAGSNPGKCVLISCAANILTY